VETILNGQEYGLLLRLIRIYILTLAGAGILAAGIPAAAAEGAGRDGAPSAPAGGRATEAVLVARARYLMGAPLEARAFATPERRAETLLALDRALDEVQRLDGVLSNWKEDSELTMLNRAAAAGPVPCSFDLFEALSAAMQAAAATGGAFDSTVEPWVAALGLRNAESPDSPPVFVPASAASAAGQPRTSPVCADADVPLPPRRGTVRLDAASRSARFSAAGVGVDLGGIGKGFALDRAAGVLRQAGVAAALLNFGGQVLALGAPPGEEGWIVDVADPRERMRPALQLRLHDASVSTSANSERGVWRDGKWIGHVLDPGTGRPAPYPGSATAVAPDATRADAYSTALLVMGPESGLKWAGGRADVAAAYLEPSTDGAAVLRATSSFQRYREAGRREQAAR
jgi:thiamine biosynthesis lipoprotein ApbE